MIATIKQVTFTTNIDEPKEDEFDINFAGELMVKVRKSETSPTGYEIINAMDGYGVNRKSEFQQATIEIF